MDAEQNAVTLATDRLDAYHLVRDRLVAHRFVVQNEADLQAQVLAVLAHTERIKCSSEVRATNDKGVGCRYDIAITFAGAAGAVRLVLELKVSGSANAVERQAQRYALTENVDLVAVVTTSIRLARRLLESPPILGGKPFHVITLRTF